MTNTESIKIAAIAAYCDQFNETAELLDNDRLTAAEIESSILELDSNSFRISILNDDCDISILALRITITTDRFATNDETIKFFLSADNCAYIPLP